ncbi:hypothetical protein BVE84_00635 [Streptococcus azizii]|uniref:Uncharacterized protein n=1 Tax=Streptococcus azizii TaxID=1579424 RepID=A0AB36JMY8_9STRE|nr:MULTISPECIES: hypothetical protein [Streptococcus]MBF0776206.1 hypothetical protein [Streptococcus sp. 19428wD3_AN2]ONK28067.1 hypothetical protein BVE86_03425 [Streptococcus azizii]ONK30465.1 hypothetical protein BVE85_00675 [Streptococcus azizii]ONK31056.1 hypothetical protein BVE84_00635 [Streptococcus azizii]TFU83337.1 hypothetical protein E4T83_05380 [Streptococcus sp. AN2]
MNNDQRKRATIAVLPILCINFGMNLHRVQFEHVVLLTFLVNTVVLAHPILIGLILYRLWKLEKNRKGKL